MSQVVSQLIPRQWANHSKTSINADCWIVEVQAGETTGRLAQHSGETCNKKVFHKGV